MPAVYAIAEIANSTDDPRVKIRALGALAEPCGPARSLFAMSRSTP
jgi:hypothetical protein